jgi:hypothetical protein
VFTVLNPAGPPALGKFFVTIVIVQIKAVDPAGAVHPISDPLNIAVPKSVKFKTGHGPLAPNLSVQVSLHANVPGQLKELVTVDAQFPLVEGACIKVS